jgi:hypothetical protein
LSKPPPPPPSALGSEQRRGREEVLGELVHAVSSDLLTVLAAEARAVAATVTGLGAVDETVSSPLRRGSFFSLSCARRSHKGRVDDGGGELEWSFGWNKIKTGEWIRTWVGDSLEYY